MAVEGDEVPTQCDQEVLARPKLQTDRFASPLVQPFRIERRQYHRKRSQRHIVQIGSLAWL